MDSNNTTQTDINENLLNAVQEGHISLIKSLLSKNADINVRATIDGFTPLMLAARWGHTDVVSTLIELGADVKIKDGKGQTALFWSTKSRSRETVLKLIENKLEINDKNTLGETALMCAASEKDNDAVVSLLIENGAQLSIKDQNTIKLLSSALIQADHQTIIFKLFEAMSFEERSSLENNIFLNPYVKTFYQEEKKDLQNKIKKIIQTFADEDSLASPCIDIVLSYVVPKTHSEEILLAKNLMMTPLFLSVAASQPEKNLHESDQAKINPIKNSI